MAGYVGKVQIGGGAAALVGSTLYGICSTAAATAAKRVTSTENSSGKFINDNLTTDPIQGTTIHVKFTLGNTVESNMTLIVGTGANVQAHAVVGRCVCEANTIISFTYDENQQWVVNDNVNTEYVFKSEYNSTNKRIISENDVGAASAKGVDTSITVSNTDSVNLPTTAAVAAYVQEQTGGLSGLTGAMHFRGAISSEDWPISAADSFADYVSGDVVLAPNDKEYVYVKGNSAANSEWVELGDESSYALKSSTDTITEVASLQTVTVGSASNWSAGTQASLTIDASSGVAASLNSTDVSIPNVTSAGSAATFEVTAGVLTITPGEAPSLGTAIAATKINSFTTNIPTAVTFTPNTLPSLDITSTDASKITTSNTTVVVPDNNPSP